MLGHMIVLVGDHHPIRPTREAYLRTERIAHEKIESSYPALVPYFDELCKMFAERPHFFED